MAATVARLIVLAVMALGLILLIIGFATREWARFHRSSQGLWGHCFETLCGDIPEHSRTGALIVVRLFITICLIASILAFLFALVHLVMDLVTKSAIEILPKFCLISSLVAVICMIIGVIIFAESEDIVAWGTVSIADSKASLGVSFVLTIIGVVLLAVCGVIYFILK